MNSRGRERLNLEFVGYENPSPQILFPKHPDRRQGFAWLFFGPRIPRKNLAGDDYRNRSYIGEDDFACHASKGKTPRTEVMYGEPGHAYVYMIYGMYHCLNIVTEKKDFPAAVLIRGAKISRHRMSTKRTFDVYLDGPGKLCKFLKIDRKLNKWDLVKGEKLWMEHPKPEPSSGYNKVPRIGIDYARHCREYLWRFSLKL